MLSVYNKKPEKKLEVENVEFHVLAKRICSLKSVDAQLWHSTQLPTLDAAFLEDGLE
jgi:hypothetical protein